MASRKGRGGWDADDYGDYSDDFDDEYDDDGYDAYDRGGGGATVQAKAKAAPAKKAPVLPPAGRGKAKAPATKAPGAKGPAAKAAAPAPPQPPPAPSTSTGPDVAAAVARLTLGTTTPTTHTASQPYTPEPRLAAALAAGPPHPPRGRHPGELHLVILGHVDAGKSTLTGRLLADVGAVPGRAAAALARAASAAGKGSFGWAWLLDASEDERSRGVTVDVAAARFGPTRHWGCVAVADAPGHRDFVPAAMTGAACADAAVLVVDGTPGGFEAGFSGGGGGGSGQTREHAALARALGVDQVIVAVTKLDGLGWPADRFDAVRAALGPFLASLGFAPSRTQWLPVSAPDGQNVSAPPTHPHLASWWGTGGRGGGVEPGGTPDDPYPTLASAVDALSPVPRDASAPLRLPVADVGKGPRGTVTVAGRIAAGAVCGGMRLVVVPGGVPATVESLSTVQPEDGDGGGAPLAFRPAQLAVAGQGVEVCLAGLPGPEAVAAGCVLCPASAPAPTYASFTARVVVMDTPGAPPLLRGASVTLHAHALREAAVVSGLVALLDAGTGDVVRQKPRLVPRGASALVTITPARPVALDAECTGLGRIALRDGGRTVAVGVVVGGG